MTIITCCRPLSFPDLIGPEGALAVYSTCAVAGAPLIRPCGCSGAPPCAPSQARLRLRKYEPDEAQDGDA